MGITSSIHEAVRDISYLKHNGKNLEEAIIKNREFTSKLRTRDFQMSQKIYF